MIEEQSCGLLNHRMVSELASSIRLFLVAPDFYYPLVADLERLHFVAGVARTLGFVLGYDF